MLSETLCHLVFGDTKRLLSDIHPEDMKETSSIDEENFKYFRF